MSGVPDAALASLLYQADTRAHGPAKRGEHYTRSSARRAVQKIYVGTTPLVEITTWRAASRHVYGGDFLPHTPFPACHHPPRQKTTPPPPNMSLPPPPFPPDL